VALAHGTNDAQKTMGIITLVLIAAGSQAPGSGPQLWVITACALAIAIGTYAGGWRIIRTMGSGLTEVKPAQGFAAETSTASAILASSHLGFALSTTQVASGSVIGSGMGRRGTTVRWNMVGKIALGWLFTLPAAGVVGALTALLVKTGAVGVLIAAIAGSAAVLFMFFYSRKSSVSHQNAVEVEEAGQAVRFAKKKAMARARAEAKAKAKADAKTNKPKENRR
jgi:PiT family inorganic phosphate transporter